MGKNLNIKEPANFAYKFRIYPDEKQIELIHAGFKLNRNCYNFFLNRENENNNLATLQYFLSIYPNDQISFEKKDEKNKRKSFLKNGEVIDFKKFNEKNKKELRTFVNNYKKENDLFFKEKGKKELGIDGAYQTYNKFNKEKSIAPKSLLIYSIESFKNALDRCYKKTGGFPKFKSYKDSNQSYSVGNISNLNIRPIKIGNRYYIDLPKLKNLLCVIHNNDFFHNQVVKKATISKNCNNEYYVSFSVHEKNLNIPEKKEINYDTSLGIDANIGHLNFDNNFSEIKTAKIMQEYNDQLNVLNKKLSFKIGSKKGEEKSNSYKRIQKQYNKIHRKISNIRNYRNHIIANSLLNLNADTLIIEDLNVKKMLKRSKNETERSKQNTKEKRSLRRNILDMGWNDLYTKLKNKSIITEKNVVEVDASYTTKTCNNCGYVNHNLLLKNRTWICPECKTEHNRDVNASKNIKDKYFKKGVYSNL